MIRIKRKSQRPPQDFPDISTSSFLTIDLKKYVDNTQVSKVGILKECYESINQWVNHPTNNQRKEAPPEIGGFVLGRYQQQSNNNYQVSLEYFVPFEEVAGSSSVHIDFGTLPLFFLETAQTQYAHLRLIGWFHTHPGHTPYLSAIDLYTHNGFFQKPYQLAIVLDPLTPQFDTGIFSRKVNHDINNYDSFSSWILWKSIPSNT